jgi:hypothetical protein
VARAAKKKEAVAVQQAQVGDANEVLRGLILGAGAPIADWQSKLASSTNMYVTGSGLNYVAPVSGSQSYSASALTVR